MHLTCFAVILHFIVAIDTFSIPHKAPITGIIRHKVDREANPSRFVSTNSNCLRSRALLHLSHHRSQDPTNDEENLSKGAEAPQQAPHQASNSTLLSLLQQETQLPTLQSLAPSQSPTVEATITRCSHIVMIILTLFNINVRWRLGSKQDEAIVLLFDAG